MFGCSGGGWFNNAKLLLRAWSNRNWKQLDELAEEYTDPSRNPQMADLVDTRKRKRSWA